MDDNVQGNGQNVVIDICDDSSNDDGNDEKQLEKLTEEEVYQMTFDMHKDGETFYNVYAKVNGFSSRNYNMHKDNVGIVKSRNVTLERSSGKYLVNNFVSLQNHPIIGPNGIPFSAPTGRLLTGQEISRVCKPSSMASTLEDGKMISDKDCE
ncbi:hypothetical protein RHSIM_Rhsim02G0166500 [Rhododendron simsii]|uniref:Uncharacterized protein n=1 Tax=Rhododendron simsii TaxID=118357 RepID=A0A834H966_RHOSS|nr:hypothetical protein RHSIM_Rhsim02G0166500 [Rhododendron simsii]